MSALDELISTPLTVDIKEPAKKSLPKGRARATLVEYGTAREVVGKASGQLWEILPCTFLVEGQPYNAEVGRESLRIRYNLWVALDDSHQIDTGKKEDGNDKNSSLARFFKAFGRDTMGTSFSDLVGSDVTLGFEPEVDNRTGEQTGYLIGTFVGKAS